MRVRLALLSATRGVGEKTLDKRRFIAAGLGVTGLSSLSQGDTPAGARRPQDVGSSAGAFTQQGAGAVDRSLQSKARDIINVADFGAVGDGVTDDTDAIQKALNTASGQTVRIRTVFFESGKNYKTTRQLTCPATVYVNGNGAQITSTLNVSGQAVLAVGQRSMKTYRHKIENLDISFAVGTSSSAGINLINALQVSIERCYISAFTVAIQASGGASDPFVGWLHITDCYFQGGNHGLYLDGVPANVVTVSKCRFLQHALPAISAAPATSISISDNDFSICPNGIVRIQNGAGIRIERNYTEKCAPGVAMNQASLVTLSACTNVSVTDNILSGLYGTWRDQKLAAYGVYCAGCTGVRIVGNYCTFFREAAAYFDPGTGGDCAVRDNLYVDNFPNPIGFKYLDLSGTVDSSERMGTGGRVAGFAARLENYVQAPSDLAGPGWAHGRDTEVHRRAFGSSPPGDTSGAADLIAYSAAGSAKNSTLTTVPVANAVGEKWALRFWASLDQVTTTTGLSALSGIKVRIFKGSQLLASRFVNISKHWSFYEIHYSDPGPGSRAIRVEFAPSDLVYMAFSWTMKGVQLARDSSPYLFKDYVMNALFVREAVGRPAEYPRIATQGQYAFAERFGTSPPTSGTWEVRDVVWNQNPRPGGVMGWVCVSAGAPGIWKAFGPIAA